MGTRSPAGSIWFDADWSDPWIEGIAAALPCAGEIRRIGAVSERPTDQTPPDLLIMHRARLAPRDAERFASWKKAASWPRFPDAILCYGPFARYAELERWLMLVDDAVSEATAADTLPHRVERRLDVGPEDVSPFRDESARVVVVSTNPDLRRTIGDVCAEWFPGITPLIDLPADERIVIASGANATPGPTVTVIDVPLLEPGWESRIERASRWGPVIALFGFPDRATVESARRYGAWACLELPFERDDLSYALRRCLRDAQSGKRATLVGFEPGHRLPRAPSSSRITIPRRSSHRDA